MDDLFGKLDALDDALDSVGTDKLRTTVVDTVSAIISAITEIIEQKNYSLAAGSTLSLIDYSGRGRLHEVTVISSSNSFKITITVNGIVVWDKSYDEAASITDEVVMVSAFQREDGKYVYHISDFPFTTNLKVDIVNLDTANPITLDYVVGKYEKA